VKFIQAVEEHMRHLGVDGHFQAPRFFGYYFCGSHPVVLARHWKVTLDAAPLLTRLRHILEGLTDDKFSIVAKSEQSLPDFLLVHDRHDGSCWLWNFADGQRFVEAHEPVANQGVTHDEAVEGEEDSGRKLMGP
jgi:hypothetical protein